MLKPEIRAKLQELGIEYPENAKKEELLALLDQAQDLRPEETALQEVVVSEDATVTINELRETVTITGAINFSWAVHAKNGSYIRTYSVADHGPTAQALAKQFAEKIEGTVKET